jgi:tripartite-type tricarboxylate transporter receptor subunit TctC
MPEKISRVVCGALIAALSPVFGASFSHGAETWPNKPVRVIAPFAAGGATDVFARLVAQRLQVTLKQGVVVDNRGGAGGLLGTDMGAKAEPDGYTLLFTTNSTTTIGPNLYQKVPYDALKDLTPVNKVITVVGLLVVHPRIKANTVAEFIVFAKSQTAPLTFCSSGTGAIGHLAGELFQAKTGVALTHVPYKGGGPSITGLIGGETDSSFAQFPTVIQHIKAGRLKLLAVTTSKRTKLLPDVPTVAEAGVPGYGADAWQGLFGPARLPRAIVTRLDSEVRAMLKLKEFVDTLNTQGAEGDLLGPEEFAAYLRKDFAQWKQLIDRNNIRIQ